MLSRYYYKKLEAIYKSFERAYEAKTQAESGGVRQEEKSKEQNEDFYKGKIFAFLDVYGIADENNCKKILECQHNLKAIYEQINRLESPSDRPMGKILQKTQAQQLLDKALIEQGKLSKKQEKILDGILAEATSQFLPDINIGEAINYRMQQFCKEVKNPHRLNVDEQKRAKELIEEYIQYHQIQGILEHKEFIIDRRRAISSLDEFKKVWRNNQEHQLVEERTKPQQAKAWLNFRINANEEILLKNLEDLVKKYQEKLRLEIDRICKKDENNPRRTFSENESEVAKNLVDKYIKCLRLLEILEDKPSNPEAKDGGYENSKKIENAAGLQFVFELNNVAYPKWEQEPGKSNSEKIAAFKGLVQKYEETDYKQNTGLGYHRHSWWDTFENGLRLLLGLITLPLGVGIYKAHHGTFFKRTEGEQLIEKSKDLFKESESITESYEKYKKYTK